jgi:hypothetical protein
VPFTHIGSIKTNGRAIDPDDDIRPLAEHIHNTGLQVPVLVDEEMNLIDGLRRLEAVRSLGNTEIEVTIASIHSDAEVNLTAARTHGVHMRPWLPHGRMWQIYKELLPLGRKTRSKMTKGQPRYIKGLTMGGRATLWKVFGLRNDSELQALCTVYRRLERGEARALTAVKRLEAGEITIHSAEAYARNPTGGRGNINNVSDQREFFSSIRASLYGLGHSLDQMGRLNPRLSRDEVAEYLRDLSTARTKLSRFIRSIAEENKQR